jgi:hypothetical protein
LNQLDGLEKDLLMMLERYNLRNRTRFCLVSSEHSSSIHSTHDSLPFGVFSESNSISDNIFQEHLQNTAIWK